MEKNLFLEKIEDENIKSYLYDLLKQNVPIGYSFNDRGIPGSIYSNDEIHFIIEPSQSKECYCDGFLLTINEIVLKYLKNSISDIRECLNDSTTTLEDLNDVRKGIETLVTEKQYAVNDIIENLGGKIKC